MLEAKDIMTRNVVCIKKDIPVVDAIRLMSKNNITGIANIYDVLYQPEDMSEKKVKEFVREPVYINKNDGLDIALARLRHRKQPMGIVTEEDGKSIGLITIEDILEEIVGEIEDRG